MKHITYILITLYYSLSFGQQKEIVLVGTMHQVSKILKNS